MPRSSPPTVTVTAPLSTQGRRQRSRRSKIKSRQCQSDPRSNVAARLHRLLRPRRLHLDNQVHELSPATVDQQQQLDPPPPLLPSPSTSVSVHWDNLQVTGSTGHCSCCEALETGVTDYRWTVRLMYRRFLVSAQAIRCIWREEGLAEAVISVKTDELYTIMMPTDSFFNQPMAEASDDALMAFIFTYTDLPFTVIDRVGLNLQVAVHSSTRRLCREVFRPFAALAEQENTPLHRVYAPLSETDWSETVTGVMPSTETIGFTYVVRQEASPT